MATKLKDLATNRWLLTGLGIAVLALLVWFAGDAIAVYDRRPLGSAASRIGLIVFIVLCWAGWEAFKHYRAWRANKQMLGAIAGDGASNSALSQREVAELKQRFDQAMGVLRKARFADTSGGRSYLYQLPWYMFIGAPGSGKTTALINSGLRFPLADSLGKDAVKGVGGTRNCDWWFTDEAVLLDTAGRYTTQSSNREVDASAWMGFLGLLKKFRPQQPLNGAIVTLSVADLFVSSPEERAEYARSVRARIQELYSTLGVRFPLYVMVSKCDLLAGFTEFFNDLGREARAQVWGTTFEFNPATPAAASFEREFDLLVERLNLQLFARMEEERDPQRRAVLFAFPQQFAAVKGLVKGFLDEVFQSSAFAEQAILRGVYFTSATQEGSPFDRVLGNLSRAYGLERQVIAPTVASGKSFFLTRLMREVVFAESDIGGRSAVIEKRRGRLLAAGYAVLGVLALFLLAGWSLSFVRNQALISEVSRTGEAIAKQVAALPKPLEGDVTVPLAALNALRTMPTGFDSREDSPPLSLGLGLYQGAKLGTQADLAYLNLLRDAFMPRVASRLERQIREAPNPEVRYEALKTYLMLHDPKHLDATEVEAWVTADWDRVLPREVQAGDRAALAKHLRSALEQKPLEMALPIDRALVDEVRRQLASASLAERAYARIRRLGPGADVPDFRVSEAAGPSAALLLTRASGTPLTQGVSATFTVAGYDKAFRAQAPGLIQRLAEEESWVLGPQFASQGATRALTALQEVQRLYLNDYIRAWDELLGDLRLVPASSLQASIQSITVLSAVDSPLKQLLTAVARETKLASGENRSVEAGAAKAIDKVTNAVKSRVDRLLGDPAPAVASQARPEAIVDRHFEPLHRAVAAAPGTPAPLDAVLGVLKEYEVQLRATEAAIARGVPPQSDAMVLARIKSEADRMPPPVSNLLNGLVARSTGQAASSAQAGVEKSVAGEVGATCKQSVEGRYPFAKPQAREVPLGDFARLFGPNGTFDAFVKTKLVGMVDTTGPVWTPIKLAAGVDGMAPSTIAQFQRAAVIREAFFPGGAANPSATADLLLVRVDEGVTEVQLTVDGQVSRLVPGGASAVRLSWPSLNPAASVKLAASISGRPDAPVLQFDGPWALFRMIDAARQEGGSPERALMSFAFGDRRAVFELRSATVRNPFRLPELSQFRCPG